MAHPYKQKYNNFNGPGHDSPAENKLIYKLLEKASKPVRRKLDDIWQASKKVFDPRVRKWDNSVDWSKTKSRIGKLTIGGTLINEATTGEEERQLYDRNEIKKDNIIFNNSNRNVKETTDYFKRGDLEKSE